MQIDLKASIEEQEKLLRETVDPQLYETFRKMIFKEEKIKLDQMRVNKRGCTDKCRVKNTYLELDIARN